MERRRHPRLDHLPAGLIDEAPQGRALVKTHASKPVGELACAAILKIDVEGGAGAVLAGAQTLLALHRTTIYIELHGPEEQKAVRELLAKSGYQAQTLSGEVVSDPTAGWFSPLVCKPR